MVELTPFKDNHSVTFVVVSVAGETNDSTLRPIKSNDEAVQLKLTTYFLFGKMILENAIATVCIFVYRSF